MTVHWRLAVNPEVVVNAAVRHDRKSPKTVVIFMRGYMAQNDPKYFLRRKGQRSSGRQNSAADYDCGLQESVGSPILRTRSRKRGSARNASNCGSTPRNTR